MCSTFHTCVVLSNTAAGWINNCVGLGNLRLFLLFLVSNVTMCLYGGVLACMILVSAHHTPAMTPPLVGQRHVCASDSLTARNGIAFLHNRTVDFCPSPRSLMHA